jgi:hypothetical protein
MGGGAPPPSEPAGGAPPPSEPAGGGESPPPTTERLVRKDLDLLLEETLFNGTDFLDLSKGRVTLSEIDKKLTDLINK